MYSPREIRSKWKEIVYSKAPDRLNVTFPCTDNNIHTFSLIKGDLFFHNHKMADLKAMAVMDKLQVSNINHSAACGCVKIMRFFMDRMNSADLSYGFWNSSSVRDAVSFTWSRRAARKGFQAVFPAPTPPEERIKNKFCEMVTKAFRKDIKYRQPTKAVFRGGQYVSEPTPFSLNVSVGAEPNITGYLKETKHNPDIPVIDVTLPLSYYSRVFTKGLAVIDGNIILAKLFDFDNGSFLGLVGKQTYGYKITKEYAVIHPERNHISYIGEEKAKEILVNGKTPRSRRTKKELGK